MDPVTARFLAQALVGSTAAAARPGLAFFLVQAGLATGVALEWTALPPELAWAVSPIALGLGLAFAVLETLARHHEDLDALMRDLGADRVAAGLAALSVTLLMVLAGAGEGAAASGGGELAVVAAATEGPGAWLWASLGLGLALNQVLAHWRARLLAFIQETPLQRIWSWVESGGVVALLVLLPLAPLLALAVALIGGMVLGAAWLAGTLAARAAERRHRRPCPTCQAQIRVEATLCPKCREPVEPKVLLQVGRLGVRVEEVPALEPALEPARS